MANIEPIGKHGTVIAIHERMGISQELKMQNLVEVNHGMTEAEKERTMEYLKDSEFSDIVKKEFSYLIKKAKAEKEDRSMELLTPKEACDILRVSIHTLAKWRSQEQGPDYVKTGKSVKYSRDTVYEWIVKKTVKTKQGV